MEYLLDIHGISKVFKPPSSVWAIESIDLGSRNVVTFLRHIPSHGVQDTVIFIGQNGKIHGKSIGKP